jgi:hypothetical protein
MLLRQVHRVLAPLEVFVEHVTDETIALVRSDGHIGLTGTDRGGLKDLSLNAADLGCVKPRC